MSLIELPDRLARLPDSDRATIAEAADAAVAANERVEQLKAAAFARHVAVMTLRSRHRELTLRISLVSRDLEAEATANEATYAELIGKRDLSPPDASRLDVAIFSLGHLPVHKKLMPRARKAVEAELAQVVTELAQAEAAAASVEEATLV